MAKKHTVIKKRNSSFENIFSQEEFRALIIYERTRSDRNGNCFSIIILDKLNKNPDDIKRMFEKISQIARSIDCIGWYKNDCLAIMLPDTNKDGAVIFRNKLISELAVINELSPVECYTYPSNWLSNTSEPIKHNHHCDGSKNSIEQLFINKIPRWKRVLDVTGSLILLFITSPILLITAIYIKLTSPGPVFFKQIRIGYKGHPFTFWKFRTMKYDNNESFHGKHSQSFIVNGDIPMEKLDDRDQRIFFGGKVLRKCCIDELPQLWNILIGDMSLVGPRPCIPYEAKEYLRWHTHRFDTVPGLSGLWQVSGKNKLTFKQMIRLDITYCNTMSFLGDIQIILKTPFSILKMVTESVIGKLKPQINKTILSGNTRVKTKKSAS